MKSSIKQHHSKRLRPCILLIILFVNRFNCRKQIWNHVAVDRCYDTGAFYEVTLMDERQCFGQCNYNGKCRSFEVYHKAYRVVECRLFDFIYEAYVSKNSSLVEKAGAKIYSKPTRIVYKTCVEYFSDGYLKNGVYEVELFGVKRKVFCYMEGEGGGWMAFQRRFDGSVSFEDKEWADYKDGFGDGTGEW